MQSIMHVLTEHMKVDVPAVKFGMDVTAGEKSFQMLPEVFFIINQGKWISYSV